MDKLKIRFITSLLRAFNDWRVVIGLYCGFILGGGSIFNLAEKDHSWWDGIWWAFITGLTIGYGDIYPETVTGRLTGIVLAHLVILLIVPMIIAHMTLRLIVNHDAFTHEEQEELKQNLTIANETQRQLALELTAARRAQEDTQAQLNALHQKLDSILGIEPSVPRSIT